MNGCVFAQEDLAQIITNTKRRPRKGSSSGAAEQSSHEQPGVQLSNPFSPGFPMRQCARNASSFVRSRLNHAYAQFTMGSTRCPTLCRLADLQCS